MAKAKSPKTGMRKGLTSYGDEGFSLFLRKAFIKAMGYTDDALDRPIIGITNTFSGFNACHRNVPELIEAVKRGVMLAGGLPVEFPTITLHESFAYPTSMYLRNLMAIDAEEMIRAQPCDAVVLIGGCDKTVPALLMGAASANVPAIMLVTGPMITGDHHGERLGACTDCRRYWAKFRAGEIDEREINEVNAKLAPSAGTCMVMGTASTMALCTEALGMMLPGGACPPAVMAERMRHAEASGARAVGLAKEKLTPDRIMTVAAFENALRVLLAIGGSTNAIVPTGQGYMEDLYQAGGLPEILKQIKQLMNMGALTVTGRTLGENLAAAAPSFPQQVVRTTKNPVFKGGSIAVLRGNLAPEGAIIKQAAMDPRLARHEGRAVVFESLEDLANRIDDPKLDVTAKDVLVLKNAGPKGAPGMPESGYLPIPKKLAQQGVKDMVRISDARMSGTAFGSIVLHVTPESAMGGPLALVKNGDRILLDVPKRRLELKVSAGELAKRRKAWHKPAARPEDRRGYRKLFMEQVTQADKGCDFEFCIPMMTAKAPRKR